MYESVARVGDWTIKVDWQRKEERNEISVKIKGKGQSLSILGHYHTCNYHYSCNTCTFHPVGPSIIRI
jgi:hypothetical protein